MLCLSYLRYLKVCILPLNHVYSLQGRYCIDGVIVNVLTSSAVDRGFELRSCQSIYFDCWVSGKHDVLRSKSKDWLTRNQDNMPGWLHTYTRGLATMRTVMLCSDGDISTPVHGIYTVEGVYGV